MSHRSRRAVLAGAGACVATLAGCSSMPWETESEHSFDEAALESIATLGVPAVQRRVPVSIDPSYLGDRRVAVEEVLDAVPAEIPESDVPNGVIRAEIAQMYSRATDALGRAASAPTPFERLGSLQYAYLSATEARAGYRAVTDGLTMDAVLAERPEVRADLRAFRDRRRVVGAADDATLVLQATVEDHLGNADRRLGRADEQSHVESRVLAIAEAAGKLAAARASLADARHLYEQFRANRETRPVGAVFERAGDELLADVRHRLDALPPESFTENPARHLDVTGDLGEPARELVTRAYRLTERRNSFLEEDGEGLASRVLAAHRTDHSLRAFLGIRTAVEDGAHDGPLDVGTLRSAKLDALGELERVRSDPAQPALTNVAARRVWSSLRTGDRYLGELATDAIEAYVAYVWAEALARTVGPANARVVGVLKAAAAETDRTH